MTTPDDELRQMYDRHHARLVRFFSAYDLPKDEAQDLAQEVFLRVYSALNAYRGEAEWSYLQRVARNLLINFWRDRSAVKRVAPSVEIDDSSDPDANAVYDLAAPGGPDDSYARAEARRRLYSALAHLPDGARQVIQLQLRGLKYEEIASALRITLDAVKSRRRDALRLLKAKLGDDANVSGEE